MSNDTQEQNQGEVISARVGGNPQEATRAVDQAVLVLDSQIGNSPEQTLKDELGAFRLELLAFKAEVLGDQEGSDRLYEESDKLYRRANGLPEEDYDTQRILEHGPTTTGELVHLVETLSYEELRQKNLVEKYGKGFVGRFRAFIAGELDSELIDGKNAKKAWWEREAIHKTLISIFNKKNAYAAGAAIAVGLLTGGVGAGAGVLVGSILGRGAAEAAASISGGERKSRLNILTLEREYWQRLKEMAAGYRTEADEKARVQKLEELINEYYMTNKNSAFALRCEEAYQEHQSTVEHWDKVRNWVQDLGAVAGLGGGVLYGHLAGHFSGIKGGLVVLKGQQVFHGAQRINGIWNFIGKAGEVIGGRVVPHGQIVYHVMNWAHPAAADVAARIYTAAAIKALPTLGAVCVTSLKSKRSKELDYQPGAFAGNRAHFTLGKDEIFADLDKKKRKVGLEAEETPAQATARTGTAGAAPAAAERRAPTGRKTRAELLDDSENNDLRFSRRAAMLVLARVEHFSELNEKTPEKRKEKFITEAKKALKKGIVTHKVGDKEKSDLDGEVAIALIKKAVGEDVEVEYDAPGELKEGKTNIDRGMADGVGAKDNDYLSGTTHIDHHGEESGSDTSAADLTYRTLVSLDLMEESEKIERLVRFVNDSDNMSGIYKSKENFDRSHRTVAGLVGFMLRDNKIIDFFENDPNPDPVRELSDDELKKYGLIFTSKKEGNKEINLSAKQKATNEKTAAALRALETGGKVIDSPHGKIVVDEKGEVTKEAFAASGYAIHIKKQREGYFISNMPEGFSLTKGQRVRNMWLRANLSIDQIIVALTGSGGSSARLARAA